MVSPTRIADALTLVDAHPEIFTLQYPPSRAYFQEHFRAELDWRSFAKGCDDEILLYAHVPFCVTKCTYCNFAVDIRSDRQIYVDYVDKLIEQIQHLAAWFEDTRVGGIDIGGGTPTLLDAELLARLLRGLKPWRARSVTAKPLSIETTPEIAAAHPERLAALVEGGVTRISMGVQSTEASEAALIGRSAQQGWELRAMEALRHAGFERVNVDLMFGLPDQDASSWLNSLENAISLQPDSITTYDCLYRGKGRTLSKRCSDRPSPVVYGDLYHIAHERLTAAGYSATYGSVNFSRHTDETGTSPYFEGRLLDGTPYVGVGNYASSQVGFAWGFAPLGVRAWQAAIESGAALPMGDSYKLPAAELMSKQLLLSLNFGIVDARRFERRFAEPIRRRFGAALDFAVEQGWLVLVGDVWSVRRGQFSKLPSIRALLYSDAAIEWLKHSEAAK